MKAILSTLAVTGVSATAVHSKTMVTPQPPATPTLESLLEISKDKNNNLGQAKVDEKSVKDEMRKLGFFQTEFDDKVKSLGLDRKKHLDGMSAQKAEHQWHQQLREIQKKADHKRRTMKNDEALKTLEGKLSRKEREELSFLMTKKDEFVATGKLSADDKEMFVRAMVALNDMYLAIDDERINTLTTCTVTLFDMYRKVFFHWQTIRELEGMIGQSYSDLMKAAQQWWSSNMDKYAQESTLAQVKAVQNGRMQELNIDLEKKESDAALFRFIIGHVGSQCASGGLQKKEGGLLLAETASKMSNEERAQCSKFCAARADDPITKNAVLLKIFSDPAVEQQAMDNLDRHAVHSYQETLRNLREAEREEVHPKYQKQHAQSFLQKGMTSTSAPSNPGGPPRWQIVDQAHCGCGTLEDAGCPALLTLIGQELECAKQIVREQEAKINDQQEKDKAERDEINQAIKQLEAAIANYVKIVLASYNEMKSYREMVWQNLHTVWQFWYETETERFKCYLKLSELEANSFCAIKHIRSFMKGIALQALGLDEEDVQDCQYADFMRETGECFAMNGEVSKCIEGDVIPSDVELLPKATWTRDLIKPLKQSDKVEKAIGSNATIAMACPSTKALKMKCNTFLCPLDCEISEFSEWSKCTAECDTGFQQRTAQVVTMSRNGGNSCPETQESRECNTHSCDVDCVLHEAFEADPVGCLKACVNGPEPRNMLLRKHIKEEAIGKGTCPERNNPDRAMVVPCDGPARYCNGDEVCSDTMDLVIAYECSNSVTQLGCWFMASFVVSLMERMPASSYGFATLKLGLVKFGNGMSLPDESNPGTYYVQDAVALSPLTFDHASISGQLYGDAMKLWTVGNSAASIGQESRGGETWQLGYNNLGQALKKSQEILDASDRVEGDVVAIQKVIVLTKGKRAQCTIAREVATTMKEKGIFIDVILFSADYETNTKPYEILHDVASFPYQEHVTVIPGLHTLSSWHSRYQNVVKLIPSICPKAVSPTHAIRKQCAMKALKLHQGRTCGDWTEKLSDKPVKLEDCVNAAIEGGYKSFVFTDTNHPKYEGEKEANCFTNKKDGKLEAFDPATFKPLESNCKYKADYDKDNKDAGGWLKQDLASGNGELTAHYAVLESKSACPKPWDYRYKKQIFSDTFQPEAYVVKK